MRKASKELTAKCAQEIIWSMDDAAAAGNLHVDKWAHIADYVECGPIYHEGKEYVLDGDELDDAIAEIRRKA